jgi:cell division septum initiation protein DivIVA
MRPEDLTISGLPRSALPGGLRADAVDELVKRAASDLRSARARIEQLEAKVASLEANASTRKDPYGLGKAVLASAYKLADEQRETARHESQLVLKKAEGRAVRIELDAQRRLDDGISRLEQLEKFRGELSSQLRSTLEAIVALGGANAGWSDRHTPNTFG